MAQSFVLCDFIYLFLLILRARCGGSIQRDRLILSYETGNLDLLAEPSLALSPLGCGRVGPLHLLLRWDALDSPHSYARV